METASQVFWLLSFNPCINSQSYSCIIKNDIKNVYLNIFDCSRFSYLGTIERTVYAEIIILWIHVPVHAFSLFNISSINQSINLCHSWLLYRYFPSSLSVILTCYVSGWPGHGWSEVHPWPGGPCLALVHTVASGFSAGQSWPGECSGVTSQESFPLPNR